MGWSFIIRSPRSIAGVMIRRDIDAAARTAFDLVVVGGGVYGVALTLEAARRGFAVALLEKGDFGSRTSWNSLRIVHGGLRYLQSLDLARYRESIAERTWFMEHFPDLVEPLACIMPLYNRGLKRPAVLRAALALNDFLSRKRNERVRDDRILPSGQVLSRSATLEWCPGIDRKGLSGAALWYDAKMNQSQRVLIEMLHWAGTLDAVTLNYVSGDRLLVDGDTVRGIEVVDVLTGNRLEIESSVVVNCAGPWCRAIAGRFDRDIPDLFSPSLAFNLLFNCEPPSRAALAVSADRTGGRTYFVLPWNGKTLAGTYHTSCEVVGDEPAPDECDVSRFVDDLALALPELDVRMDRVVRVLPGFLPASGTDSVEPASRAVIRHHGSVGGPQGLFSVSGVKFTTARRVAEQTLQRMCALRGLRTLPAASGVRPPGTTWPDRQTFRALLEQDREQAADHVRRLYRDESVVHLDDFLLRRTDWGMEPEIGRQLGKQIGDLMNWSRARVDREISRL